MTILNALPTDYPTFVGERGKAWAVDLVKAATGKAHSSIGQWVIYAPYAHHMWHSYALSLIHLRHVHGVAAATFLLDGATHELMLFALDPAEPIVLPGPLPILSPMNFGAQIIERSDATAIARMEEAVQDVVDGVLNPDTDNVRDWIVRFGGSNMRGMNGEPISKTLH